MSDIVKKKKTAFKKKANKKTVEKKNESEEYESLTPWQRENLKYTKDKGNEPAWHPSVLQYEDIQRKKQENEKEKKAEADGIVNSEKEKAPEPVKELPKGKSFADKLPNLSKERNRRLKRRLTVIFLVLGVLFLGLLYYISPFSKLDKITVTGNSVVSTETIIEESKLKSGEIIWRQFFDKGNAEKRILKANNRLKQAEISLKPLNNFKIQVEEYKVIGYSLEDRKYYDILENGSIMKDQEQQPSGNLPILVGFDNSDTIKEIMTAYTGLSDELKNNISELTLTPKSSNPYLVTIFMNDGNQVLISIGDIGKKLPYYSQVVSQLSETGVIDMEASIFFDSYGNLHENVKNETKNEKNDE